MSLISGICSGSAQQENLTSVVTSMCPELCQSTQSTSLQCVYTRLCCHLLLHTGDLVEMMGAVRVVRYLEMHHGATLTLTVTVTLTPNT